MDDAIAVSFNVDWFDANVSTPKMRQLEADLSEARRQVAEQRRIGMVAERREIEARRQLAYVEAKARKANEDAGMYLWEVGQWQSQCAWTNDVPSAVQEELSAAQRDLAEAREALERQHAGTDAVWNEKHEVMCQLAEARKIVWGLVGYCKASVAHYYNRDLSSPYLMMKESWDALPRWLRKEIER